MTEILRINTCSKEIQICSKSLEELAAACPTSHSMPAQLPDSRRVLAATDSGRRASTGCRGRARGQGGSWGGSQGGSRGPGGGRRSGVGAAHL
eukprot:778756-Pleurochrysis_carterae.AAC.1